MHKKNMAELKHLKKCLRREVMVSQLEFSWLRTLHRFIKCPDRRFYFWWRTANYLYKTGISERWGTRINRKLRSRYGLDIKLGANIGEGLSISHYVGIVIADRCVIGENFYIKQNVTIGVKKNNQLGNIYIGDNVEVGANSCIVGDNLRIGDNVIIGAMSFINKDVPSNCTVYTEKHRAIINQQLAHKK